MFGLQRSAARQLRVLMIVENLPVPFDRRVWNEATALRSAGNEVTVICPRGKDATAFHECIDGIHIYRHFLPTEGRGLLGFAVEYSCALACQMVLALWIALRRGFDVIHICNPPELMFLVGGFFKLFGKKLIFDHHDLSPELYEAKFNRRDRMYRLLLLLERLTFKTCDISIATNESFKKIAIERGGMISDRVFVVRSGPDVSRFRKVAPMPELFRGRSFLVAYLGVIGKQDGLDLLMQSIHNLVVVGGRRDIQFIVLGSGPELSSIKQMAATLGISDFVTFTGRVSDDMLLTALSTADICVNPDRVNEANDKSTMNKTMEYMALGKPIVQFDMTEGRASAGAASLYARANDPVDFAACIASLLADPQQRELAGDVGRQRVLNELSWSHEAPKLLAAYDFLARQDMAQHAPLRRPT